MRFITKVEFAKRAKVTRQSVYRAIKREQVIETKSGKIDISHKLNKEYLEINVNLEKCNLSPKKPVKKKQKKVDIKPKNKKPETKIKPKSSSQKHLKSMSRNDLDKMKIITDITQKQVKTEKEREMLIPRDTVKMVFSKLYIIDVNQWRTLGPNLASEIASIVGIDDDEIILKISEKIDKESFKILKQVKRLFNDFLKDIKSELRE